MAKKEKTPKTPKATAGKPNPSAGVPRPFVTRNRARLGEIGNLLRMLITDLGRAPADNASVRAAVSACADIDKAAGEVDAAIAALPADFSVRKPQAKSGGWLAVGKQVRLTAEAHADYDAKRVGPLGTVGIVEEEIEVGMCVRFVADRVAVVRKAHLERADKPAEVVAPTA